jgi:hypothetical protein
MKKTKHGNHEVRENLPHGKEVITKIVASRCTAAALLIGLSGFYSAMSSSAGVLHNLPGKLVKLLSLQEWVIPQYGFGICVTSVRGLR